MANIEDQTSLITSTPKEAAENIEAGSIFNIEPAAYKSVKSDMQAQVEAYKKPTEASDTTKEYMSQGSEQAALAQNDTEHMSYLDRQAHLISDYLFDRPTIDRKVIDLSNKKMNRAETFSEQDQIDLDNANFDRSTMARRNYGLDGPYEQMPAKVLGGIVGMVRPLMESMATMPEQTSFADLGKPGKDPLKFAGLEDRPKRSGYDDIAGSMYNELSHAVGKDGQPLNIDEPTKRAVSHGVAVVNTALQAVIGYGMMRSTPWLQQYLNPMIARAIVDNPTNAAIMKTLMNIGSTTAINTTASGLAEVTNIVGENVAKNYNGTPESMLNALTEAGNEITTSDRVKEASTQGFITGLGYSVGAGAAGFSTTRNQFQNLSEFVQDSRAGAARDVTPEAPLQIQDKASRDAGNVVDVTPPQIGGGDPVNQSVKIIHATEAFDNMGKSMKQMEMGEHSPAERSNFMKMVFDNAGLKRVWIAYDDYVKFREKLSSPENQKKVRDAIDPTGSASEKLNAPIPIDAHKFMDLVHEFPEVTSILRVDPEGPIKTQAETYMQNLQVAENKRNEILGELGTEIDHRTWFKDSKVVDENGNPLTVYHGSGKNFENFKKSDTGIYFSPDPKTAGWAAENMPRRRGETDSAPVVYPSHLSLKNPFILNDQSAKKMGLQGTIAYLKPGDIEKLKAAGYDGIAGGFEDGEKSLSKAQEIIVFHPSQARNALKYKTASQPEAEKTLKEALNPVKNPGDVAGGVDWHGETLLLTEDEYLNQPTFTKAIEGVLPEKEVKRINEAQLKARAAVAEQLNDKANRDLVNRTTDAFDTEMTRIQSEETAKFQYDQRYAILDKFKRESIANESGRARTSVYSIDKSLLSDDQLKRYATDPNLEAHGVWKKGGLSPDEAAQWMGVRGLTGDQLLESLARPPRKEVIAARVAPKEQGAMTKAMNEVKFDDTKLAKVFSDNTKNHIAEMKYMREKQWPATKGGIKKIALPLPTPKELTAKAREAVRSMKVGDLSLTQFKVGERVSQRAAVNAILKNEVEKAYMNKEKAALNSEMQKEVARGMRATDQAFRQFARLQSKRTRAVLAEAGPMYEKAVNEFLDVFKLDPSMRGQSEIGSFQKFAKSQYEKGVGDFTIPDNLSDVRQSANDLTVDQLLTIAHRLGTVEHLARLKNKLFGARETERLAEEKANQIATFEAIVDDATGRLKVHPDFDENRAHEAYHDQPGVAQKFMAQVSTAMSMMDNIKHIAYMMDENKPNGYFYKMFVEPLTGEGEFKNNQGFSGDVEDRKRLLDFHNKAVTETIGKKEYDALWNTWVEVPEFKGLKAYNLGKMRKSELVSLMGQLGDPDGRNNILNAGASLEIVHQVLERELTEAHARYVTNFFHAGKETYWDRTVALEKRMTGQDVTRIEGVPWNFKGKQYPGGYMRQRYQTDWDLQQLANHEDQINKRTAAIEGNEETGYYAKQRAAETTNQSRTEERVGSKKPLDLTFSNIFTDYAEIITDLNYREPVANNLKLLKNAPMKENIINTIGIQKYRVLTNTTMEVAGQHEGDNRNYFADQTRFAKDLVGDAKSGFSIARIGANVTSALVQPTSIMANALPKMGATGPKHLAMVVGSVLRRPHLIGQFFDFASQLDTSIMAEHNHMVDDLAQTLMEALPSRNKFPILAPITNTYEVMKKTSIGMIQAVDTVSKTFVSLASYRQFMAGDVEGFPIETVRGMSPKEAHEQASKYAAQISDLAMTRGGVMDKSPAQKTALLWPFTFFFNDARQTFNSGFSQGRTVKWESMKSYDNFKEGNRQAGMKSARGAAGALLGMIVAATVARYYEDKTRGYETPFDREHDLSTIGGNASAAADYASWIMSSPADLIAGTTPIVRDIKFAAFTMNQNKRDQGVVKVRNPITEVMGATATTIKFLSEVLSMDRGLTDINPKEMKQVVYAMGYAMGFPTPQIYKGYQWWTKEKDEIVPITEFHTLQNQEKLGPVQDLHEEIQKYKKDPPKGASNETLQEMDKFDKKLVQSGASVPEETNNMIKQMASGGDWKKLDPKTGAGGVYQFTPGRWADLSAENPDLGLTENGRVSKDTAQQDRAIEWESNNNARLLAGQGIPVNTESLYAAHMLGIKKAISLYQGAADDKLKAAGIEGLDDLKTVGQARKQFKKQVNDKRLTLTSTETQD